MSLPATFPLSVDRYSQSLDGTQKWLLRVFAVIAGVALMTLAAKIKVHMGAIPITLQMLALFIISTGLGARLAFATMIAYLAAGMYGMPVFTNTPPTPAGPAYFLGPTGGYLFAYPFAAAFIGWFAERGLAQRPFHLFAVMIAAMALVYGGGVLWLSYFATLSSGNIGTGLANGWLYGAQPFILPDLVKAALASALIPALWALVERFKK
jgi:biotin transport system substrate-specific component